MKKLVLYIIGVVLFCFLVPILFTEKFELVSTNLPITTEEIERYDYKQYKTIRLLHTKTKQIEELPLDEYIYGVLSAEMPASYSIEALKAQAVVARTYTIYKIVNTSRKHGDAHICDDSACCQAWISKQDRLNKWDKASQEEYWEKIVDAVDSTKGKIILYDNKVINAFFHSNSGGKTEAPIDVWGGARIPVFTKC